MRGPRGPCAKAARPGRSKAVLQGASGMHVRRAVTGTSFLWDARCGPLLSLGTAGPLNGNAGHAGVSPAERALREQARSPPGRVRGRGGGARKGLGLRQPQGPALSPLRKGSSPPPPSPAPGQPRSSPGPFPASPAARSHRLPGPQFLHLHIGMVPAALQDIGKHTKLQGGGRRSTNACLWGR